MAQDPDLGDQLFIGAAREELIADTFVRLADSLVEGYDVIEYLDFLTERCARLLGVDEVGVVLVDPKGVLHLVSCTSDRMRFVELFEIQSEEGPCQDAYRSGRAALADDLDLAGDQGRWPRFGPKAQGSGFRSAYGLPMRLRDQTVGALNLFGNRTGALRSADRRLGQAFADAATIGLLHERAATDRDTLTRQLQGALDSRVTIEQAKGIIAEQAGCAIEEAFSRTRRYARSHNLTLTTVAERIVARNLDHHDLPVEA